MFELYQRDGHGKHKIADANNLGDIARICADMSGEGLFKVATDGGERDE